METTSECENTHMSLVGADNVTDVETDIIELKGKSHSCPVIMPHRGGQYRNIHIHHPDFIYRRGDGRQQQECDETFLENDDVIELKGKSLSSPGFIWGKGSGICGNVDTTSYVASHPEAQRLTQASSYYIPGDYSLEDDCAGDQFGTGNAVCYEQSHSIGQNLYDADSYRAHQRSIGPNCKAQLAGRWLQPKGGDMSQHRCSRRAHALMVGVPHYLGSGGISSNYLYKIRFKNTTDTFTLAPSCRADIIVGDYVLVEADRGLDVGRVMEIFKEIMDISFVKKILSRASPEEVQRSVLKEKDEKIATEVCRTLVARRGLRIAIADAEYQFDYKKLTFFFISERHTDFRELVRDLFATFKTRIWMQKIKLHEVSVLRPFQLPEHSVPSLHTQPSGGYLSTGRYGDDIGGSWYESDATEGVGHAMYGPGDGARDRAGGAFVYQQQLPYDRDSHQFGRSLLPSPTYRGAGVPLFGGAPPSPGAYSQQRRPLCVNRGDHLQLDPGSRDPMDPRMYLDDGSLHGFASSSEDTADYPSLSRDSYDAVEVPRTSSDSHLVTWTQQQRSDGMDGHKLPASVDSVSGSHLSGAGQSADVTAVALELSSLSVAAKPFVYKGGTSHSH